MHEQHVMNIKVSGLHYTYSYGLYLSLGLIPWNMFSSILLRESYILFEKKNIIEKISLPLYFFPLTAFFTEFLIFLLQSILLIFILIFFNVKLNLVNLVLYFASSLFFALLGFSIGIIIATFSIFFKDLQEIIKIILSIWFWFTPIVYTMDIIPQKFHIFFEYNPIFAFFEVFHSLIMESKFFKWDLFIYDCGVALIIFAISIGFLRKLENEIRDFL